MSRLLCALFLLSSLSLPGCQIAADHTCARSTDCVPDEFCRAGQCVPAVGIVPVTPSESVRTSGAGPFFFDVGDDVDGAPGLEPSREPPLSCEGGVPPSPASLVINELLVNVPSGPDGDANGDGQRHAHDDEFVELVNVGDAPLIMTGVTITNDMSPRFTFAPFCLPPLEAVVVFGGVEPGVRLPIGPSFQAFVADRRFAYANDGGTVMVLDAGGTPMIRLDYGRAPAQALVLSPELYGEVYVPHRNLSGETLFSPGTCADGRSFATGCAHVEEVGPVDVGAFDADEFDAGRRNSADVDHDDV